MCEQILVVVAISNMRNIITDEKKGSIRTLIGYGLVDPKWLRGNAITVELSRESTPIHEREIC